MVVFHMLCTIVQSPGVQKSELLSMMGHARSAAVISVPLCLD